MKLLLDTHLLVWAMGEPSRLGPALRELPIEAAHVLAVAQLPPLHRDPFDRLLLAQAEREGLLLITADALLARYPGPVRHQGSF
ncbi:MAG: type II toxin-antitoxin system VapC family toxin [Cyanobium sp.]